MILPGADAFLFAVFQRRYAVFLAEGDGKSALAFVAHAAGDFNNRKIGFRKQSGSVQHDHQREMLFSALQDRFRIFRASGRKIFCCHTCVLGKNSV